VVEYLRVFHHVGFFGTCVRPRRRQRPRVE
jgi:hypothetical protein